MLTLAQNPFSYKDEMSKLLKLEKTKPEKIPGIAQYMAELDNLKSQFGFEEGKTIPQQKTNTTALQEKIEQYIKILFNLAFYFDPPTNSPSVFEFSWKGKVRSIYFRNQNFYYEIAGSFYNYSACYFNQALSIFNGGKPDELKLALRYFRQAMWGFIEASKAVNKCLSNGTPVPELGPQFTRCGLHVCAALAYCCLYRILKDNFKTFTPEQRQSFHKNAYHDCFKAVQSLDETSSVQFTNTGNLRAMLAARKSFHIGSILVEKSQEYEKLHADTLTAGHIGTQIAFVESLKDVLVDLKTSAKTEKDPEIMELIERAEKEVAKLKQLNLENAQVYKAKVPARDELPQIPESEYKVKPLDQPHVKTSIDELASICVGRKSKYFLTLENDFDLLINKNKQNLNVLVEDSEKRRLDLYQKNNIDVIIRLAQTGEERDLESKITEINQVYNGAKGYADLVEQLQKALAASDAKALAIKSSIEQDFQNDKAFYNQTGFRVLGLKESNNPILAGFEKHGIALTQLKQKDLQLIEQVQKSQGLLGQIQSAHFLDDMKKIKESLANSEDLKALVSKHQIVNDLFRLHLQPKEKALKEEMGKLNSKELIAEVFFNRKTTDEVYAQLDESIASKIEEFRDMLDKMHGALQKMVQLAQSVSKTMSSTNSNAISYQQKLISEVNTVSLLYTEILKNLEAHANLQKNAEYLDQVLKDYLYSKDLQKQEMIKNANAFKELNLGDFLGNIFEKNFNIQFFGRK